ncbi:MAG: GTP-dependent dephospho-CoA kinase family protein [Acidilobus sp.]
MPSEGKSLIQFRVSEGDREDFSWPRGVLISGDLPQIVKERAWTKVICVGDVVTYYCLKSGRLPDVIVVDGKTKRQWLGRPITLIKDANYLQISLDNPAGGLTPEALDAMCAAIRDSNKLIVLVRGEEDMLALPALMCAEPGSLVIYGIPERGASLVVIDPMISREAQTRLLRLTPEPVKAHQ